MGKEVRIRGYDRGMGCVPDDNLPQYSGVEMENGHYIFSVHDDAMSAASSVDEEDSFQGHGGRRAVLPQRVFRWKRDYAPGRGVGVMAEEIRDPEIIRKALEELAISINREHEMF